MENKTVLVLLSCYNGEKYIEQQIQSILMQRGVEVHLRIRDDGSCDNTKAIVERLSVKYPSKIELISGENIGLNASFFTLIRSAEGYDYYAISDQDDYWLPEKLSVAVNALEKKHQEIPLLFASTSYLADNDLKPYGQTRRQIKPFTLYNTVIQNICPGHTQVMNNALLALLQKDWDTGRIYVYDSWIMNIAMLYGQIVFSNTSFTLYRQHKTNQLGSGAGMFGQFISSGKRIVKHQGSSYRGQIAYLLECNLEFMKVIGIANELESFLSANSLMKRIKYCMNSKLYRQNVIETIGFYIAVILGKF